MNFNSSSYAILLIVVLVGYYALRDRRRQNWLLLAAGLYFYGSWDHRFLFLLMFSSAVDYIGGLGIVGERPTRRNAIALGATMLSATVVLCAPIDWHAIASAIVPADAFAGGWTEPVPWRGLFLLDGDWLPLRAALGALAALACTTVIGYRIRREAQPKYFLCVSLGANLGLLGFFKYFDFFVSSAASTLASMGFGDHSWTLGIIVPAGISFYTFQAMSYSIDVYRGVLRPTHDFPDYLLFVSFFPHLVAGPIQEANWLLPQLQRARTIDWVRIHSAVFLIGWGLFKKIFIADNLAELVSAVYASGAHPTGPQILFATYAFAFQIYGDFSAYSDIARGTARLLGIELTVNFNVPYAATNPREFWRRWHISLSTWLRDYLYVSLGGSRVATWAVYRNLLVTMILGGLWHGARMNFVLWGVYQGTLLCVHRAVERPLAGMVPRSELGRRLFNAASWVVFFHLVCYGWLLFRADGAGQIVTLTGDLFVGWPQVATHAGALARVIWFAWPLIVMDVFQARASNLLVALTWPWPMRTAMYVTCFYLAVVFGAIETVEFIYFQF
jgi:D-alanyl-lipoteichoic acid acyltransferase DltB (MBOAT superfamily)